jgi:hypothetical protein
MWSRAKREGHGAKISENVWTNMVSDDSEISEGESEISVDEKMKERMREATERGYGSEPE